MNFKVRKIKKQKKTPLLMWFRQFIRALGRRLPFVLLGGVLVGGVIWGATSFLHWGQQTLNGVSRPVLNLGPLDRDSYGHTNILFLGVAGDGGEGGNLSDSIMLASFNPKNPSVSFLSLPRDLYVESSIGSRRINEVYAAAKYKNKDPLKGLEASKDAISKFTGIDIQYGVVVNFDLFEDVVDALDGVDLFVPEDIEDPFYPADNYKYQTFVIRKGLQHLDGDTALKYARSRKTSSDYDRARRQQDILLAIKDKAQDKALLSDFDKLREFYGLFKEHVVTDLGMTELVALAKMALDIDYTNAVSAVLNDDTQQQGGYLYTPAKEFYGGRYVLLPEDLKETQLFMDLVLIHPDVLLESAQIEVLNGSMLPGKARETADRIKRLGLHVIDVGNYETDMPVFRTFIRVLNRDNPKTVRLLKRVFETDRVEYVPVEEIPEDNLTDIELVLGTN